MPLSRSALSARERDIRSRLHSLLNQVEDFLHGSVIDMTRRCGNPNCKCAGNDEHKHRSLCLGQTRQGKSSTIYIPRHLEGKVREGVSNFQRAQDLLEELNVEARIRLAAAKVKNSTKTTKAASAKKISAKKKSAKKKTPPNPS